MNYNRIPLLLVLLTLVSACSDHHRRGVTPPDVTRFALQASLDGAGPGTVSSSPSGVSCGTDCAEEYASGTLVTLTANAGSGSEFLGWSGACVGTGPCVVTMDAAKSVQAGFGLVTHTLSVSRSGSGTGTVTTAPTGIHCGVDCEEDYASGVEVTLTASADDNSTFAGWSSGGCAGTGACVVTMSASTNVTATFNAIPQIVTHFVGGTVTGLTGTVVLQNNGTDSISIASDGAFTFPNPLDAGTAYHVTALNQPATQTCSIANGAATVGSTNITNVVVTCSTNLTTLSVSTGTLVLASSGTSRRVTVTNTGMNPAANIAALSMGLPTGTSMTSTCSGTLASGGSCTVTITPGSSASSDCAMGIAPIPDTVTIAGSNSSTVASNVVVLTYGCQYQGGFVYSIDDTTASTGSIGGKVVSLVDQAAPNIASGPQTTSIIWSSNGAGSTPMDVSYDVIPGIAETPGAGDSYVQAQLSFDTEYSNTMTYPFPAASGFQACDGPVDGACNSRNIQALYDSYQTNFGIGSAPYTLSPGPTSRTNYAAGLCTATINGYSDWYLPAVCEVDAHNGNVTCPAGAQSISGNLAFLLGDDAAAVPYTSCSPPDGTSCLAGLYWTSTANSMSPKQHAWTALLSLAGSSQMYVVDKVQTLGVRCSRAFTD